MSLPYVVLEPESPQEPVLVFHPVDGAYVIGRLEEQSDICLTNATVSRRHALLIFHEGQALIQDADSTRGVIIDGQRIPPHVSVPFGSDNNIMLGEYLLYLTTELAEGVTAQELTPGAYASLDANGMTELIGKTSLLSGNTISGYNRAPSATPATSGDTLAGLRPVKGKTAQAETSAEAAAQEEARYTFPSMPSVPPEEQDAVDRLIYRRIKPLFDQFIQEKNGGSNRNANDIRDMAEDVLRDILTQQAQHLPAGLGVEDMLKLSLAAFMDYGPLQGLLGDETVTEIMVNGPNLIFVEQSGRLFQSHLRFWNDGELRRVIEKMVMVTNRRIDEQQPYQDTRLEDGSRVNVIIRPLSLGGDSITIRKFPNRRLWIEDLVKYNSLNTAMAEFLRLAVKFRASCIVSGGTGSGKTTLLNVLSNFIPPTERLVSIEDAAELRLNQANKVTLEARPKSLEGSNAITIRDLVINALRMRPDRIIVGECRGGEALDMLQAMNTGHEGSLTTLHANTPRDAIARLETLCLMAGMELPAKAIRSQIVSAVDLIVQQTRLSDGARKIVSIQEVLGQEGDQVVMQEIFTFERSGIDANGKVGGQFVATGVIPRFVSKLRDEKVDFPIDLFTRQES